MFLQKNIPPRSYLRVTIRKKRSVWQNFIKNAAKKIIAGEWTVEEALEAIGLKDAGDVRETITQIQEPPLAKATIAARKRRRANKKTTGLLTKPLIDTAIMLNSLTNVVKEK